MLFSLYIEPSNFLVLKALSAPQILKISELQRSPLLTHKVTEIDMSVILYHKYAAYPIWFFEPWIAQLHGFDHLIPFASQLEYIKPPC